MKVLLLDDDNDLLQAVEVMLSSMGHDVHSFNSAQEAADEIASGEYDFALIDYKMPEKTGIWFMQHANVPKSTKVILMTAYVNRDVINEMFKLGIRGYMIKPFDQQELVKHLSFYDETKSPGTLGII